MPLNQQDKDELAQLGIYGEAPEDSWVYRQGTVFLLPDSPPDSSETSATPPNQDNLQVQSVVADNAEKSVFRSPQTSAEPSQEAPQAQ